MEGEQPQPTKADKPKGRPRNRGHKKKSPAAVSDTVELEKIEQPKQIASRLKPPTVFTCIICAENADFYAVRRRSLLRIAQLMYACYYRWAYATIPYVPFAP